MPLVSVLGVATRQTPEYQARVRQRDLLFQRLVLPPHSPKPFDPDWGSNAVKFDPALPWLPKPGDAEALSIEGGPAGDDRNVSRTGLDFGQHRPRCGYHSRRTATGSWRGASPHQVISGSATESVLDLAFGLPCFFQDGRHGCAVAAKH
jgi:hypothetical protein